MILATATGFEPIPSESKSDVLPLHYAALTLSYREGKMYLGVNSFLGTHYSFLSRLHCESPHPFGWSFGDEYGAVLFYFLKNILVGFILVGVFLWGVFA